jgi:urease accessory protein UreF
LTLYVIEQQKQMEELRKENIQMGERLNRMEAALKK